MKYVIASVAGCALAGAVAQAQLDCTVTKLDLAGFGDGAGLGAGATIDGDTAAVGSPGEVTVYRRADDAWVVEQVLPLGVTALDLSGDTLALGDWRADGAVADSGAAWVYTRSGSTWTQAGQLVAADGSTGDRFGFAVAAGPGEVIVGAPLDGTVHGPMAGSAYVFRPGASGWTQVLHLIPADGDLDARYGRSLALAGDRLVVGSPNWQSGTGQPFTGQVYVYDRTGSGWTVDAGLLPSSGYTDEDFGHTVSLSGDRVAVGTWPLLSFADPFAYVFARSGTGWSEEIAIEFTGGSVVDAAKVALSGDLLAVGERDFAIFQRTSGWSLVGTIDTPSGTDPFTGGLELAGNRLIFGSPDVDVQPFDAAGIARIWELGLAPAAYCTGKVNSQGCLPAVRWSGSPSASSPAPFPIGASDVLNGVNGLLFFGLSGRAALPFAGGTLCVQPPLARTPVQNAGGNPPPDDCSGVLSLDFNALIQSGAFAALGPGRVVNAQYWSRDPAHPDGTEIGLTDAIELTVCP